MLRRLAGCLLALCLCLSLLPTPAAAASSGEADNLVWRLEGGVLTVEPLDPLLPCAIPEDYDWGSPGSVGSIRIGAGVSSIGRRAFYGFTSLRSVTLPNSIRYIGDRAFGLRAGNGGVSLSLRLPKAAALGEDIFAGRGSVSVTVENEVQRQALAAYSPRYQNTFRLLLIGNSYSEDASNCGQGMVTSRLLTMLQNAWPDKQIELGLLYSPGKSMAWCYDKAMRGQSSHSLRVIGGSRTRWTEERYRMRIDEALNWADWDAISLQPYAQEQIVGVGGPYYGETDDYSYSLEETLGYFLHLCGVYAPAAERLLYMCWSTTADATRLNAGAAEFSQRVRTMLETEYRGKLRAGMGEGAYLETGEAFSAVIPCGTAIQNARQTYLALLTHNPGATPVDLANDPVEGLLRDGNHVTFNMGRYLLALTFAMKLTGADAETLCAGIPLNYGTAVGPLPADYLRLVQESAAAAVADPTHITDLSSADDEDPAAQARSALEEPLLLSACREADLSAAVEEALAERLIPLLLRWPELRCGDPVFLTAAEGFAAEVPLHFGYTDLTARVTGRLTADHAWGDWSVVTPSTLLEPGLEAHRCARCGAEETAPLPALGDLDRDGAVTREDAAFFFRLFSADPAAAPDLNGDGLAGNPDALALFRLLSGTPRPLAA